MTPTTPTTTTTTTIHHSIHALRLASLLLTIALALLCSSALARQTGDEGRVSGGVEPAPTGAEAPASDRAVIEAFDRGDYAAAQRLLELLFNQRPKDPFVAYNLACAHAMQGHEDDAAETLIDAVSFGFVDFHHAQRDPHLDPLRENPKYRLVIRGWRELLDARGKAEREAAREALGRLYTSEADNDARLSFVSAIDPQSFREAQRELRRVADWAEKNVLGAEAMKPANPAQPDSWVLVLMPTPADFLRLAPTAGVGGYYDHDHQRLVTQDIGPSLRHEFFHVLHWRHADRIGQRHPLWIMEGLASLLEDVDDAPDGSYILAPSWRTNIARRLERAGRLTPWSRLFTMPREGFMGDRSRANYAQARSIFMFLLERSALQRWYQAYVSGFDEDPTGARAIESALGAPIAEVERRFRLWLRELPDVGEQAHPGDSGLGVELAAGSGDGVVVGAVIPGARPRSIGAERLRRRDVITAIEGKATRTLDDIFRVLADFKVGARVTLDIRRGDRRLSVQAELIPSRPPGDEFPL